MTGLGVCITAVFRIAAGVIEASARILASNWPCATPFLPFDVSISGEELPSLLISSGSFVTLFEPNETLLWSMLVPEASMFKLWR